MDSQIMRFDINGSEQPS